MTLISSHRCSWFVSAACLLCLAGCGSAGSFERAAVSGSVSLDGKPLKDGVVRFVPKDGTPGPKLSVPVKDGRFAADRQDGPSVGSHRVEIESLDTGGYELDDEDAIDQLKAERKRRIAVDKVPEQYNTRSVLTAEVASGDLNELNFELTSRRK
ncbi:MAG: hypothetical protein AAGG44_11480 [Planctomycetota bacterium]